MEYRNLQITVHSAKDLKNVNIFTKMDVYVVAMIVEDPRSIQRTPSDKDGGKCPKWNHELNFIVDEAAAKRNQSTLVLYIKSERALGDKDIGAVSLNLKELLDNDNAEDGGKEKIASYNVTTPSGKAQGMLDISYKVGDKASVSSATTGGNLKGKFGDEPVMAYPSEPAYAYPQPPQGAEDTHKYPPMYALPEQGGAYMYQQPPSSSQAYAYPPPSTHGYPQTNLGYGGYPPQQAGGYAYPSSYGYPQTMSGYGEYPPQQAGGYGYPTTQEPKKKKKKKSGMGCFGLGAGLLGGLLVGEMVGEMVDDVGYMAEDMGDMDMM